MKRRKTVTIFLPKWRKILFPIADYTVQIKSYETDAESTLSYEMILAMEALDENYVDENGQSCDAK